jgi:hypothetical protein
MGEEAGRPSTMRSTYNAFISYSHAVDGKPAPTMQASLHRFARPWNRVRAGGQARQRRQWRSISSTSGSPTASSRILRVHVQHYNRHRPHRALMLRSPDPLARPTILGQDDRRVVRRRDLLGGLLHEYRRAA